MKPFETIDLAAKSQNYKLFLVFRYLETLLKGLDVPDVEGEQITGFLAQNLSMDGLGGATIKVDTLEAEVEIIKADQDSVYLRNNDGVLEYSNDHTTWTPVGGGGGGSGDMLKSVYDTVDNGYVDAAGKLKNGLEEIDYADVQTAVDTSQAFSFVASVCWIGTGTLAPITFKNEGGALKVSLDDGSTWNIVTITPEV
jgi:hypothetical protein